MHSLLRLELVGDAVPKQQHLPLQSDEVRAVVLKEIASAPAGRELDALGIRAVALLRQLAGRELRHLGDVPESGAIGPGDVIFARLIQAGVEQQRIATPVGEVVARATQVVLRLVEGLLHRVIVHSHDVFDRLVGRRFVLAEARLARV